MANDGEEDDYEKICLYTASLSNDTTSTLKTIYVDKKLFEKALSKPDGDKRDHLVTDLKEDSLDRRVLG